MILLRELRKFGRLQVVLLLQLCDFLRLTCSFCFDLLDVYFAVFNDLLEVVLLFLKFAESLLGLLRRRLVVELALKALNIFVFDQRLLGGRGE